LLIIERILRDRQGIWQQIVDERDLTPLTVSMLTSSAISLACYGAVLGWFHGPLMALTSAIKLPLLFLITLAICLPTLYLFNLVFGAKLSVRQALALVMVAITVTSMLALAFAPISLFFRITAPDYGFYRLLNVAILALSALVGLRFLTGGMHAMHEHGLLAGGNPEQAAAPGQPASVPPATVPATVPTTVPATVPAAVPATVSAGVPANGDGPSDGAAAPASVAPAPAAPAGGAAPGQTVPWGPPPLPAGRSAGYPAARRPAYPQPQRSPSMALLYIWILLFGFVGTQLAWTLRPFFGMPNEPFALFRSIDGNFYAAIFKIIGGLG
jgi:hypothetical protein